MDVTWAEAVGGRRSEAVLVLSGCETLDLEAHRLGAAGAAALVPALQHAQCRLAALHLEGNGLGAARGAAGLEEEFGTSLGWAPRAIL